MPRITANMAAQHKLTLIEQAEKEENIRAVAAALKKQKMSTTELLDRLEDLYNINRRDLVFICNRGRNKTA